MRPALPQSQAELAPERGRLPVDSDIFDDLSTGPVCGCGTGMDDQNGSW